MSKLVHGQYVNVECMCIGVDLAGILAHGERRRWVGAEWGGYGEGCPLLSRLGALEAS